MQTFSRVTKEERRLKLLKSGIKERLLLTPYKQRRITSENFKLLYPDKLNNLAETKISVKKTTKINKRRNTKRINHNR